MNYYTATHHYINEDLKVGQVLNTTRGVLRITGFECDSTPYGDFLTGADDDSHLYRSDYILRDTPFYLGQAVTIETTGKKAAILAWKKVSVEVGRWQWWAEVCDEDGQVIIRNPADLEPEISLEQLLAVLAVQEEGIDAEN